MLNDDAMTHHILQATKETVHLGDFSHLQEPALTVESGDTIDVETYTDWSIYKECLNTSLLLYFTEFDWYFLPLASYSAR